MTIDFVYADFVAEDFVTEAPTSVCDFVPEDFVNTDFSICVTPPSPIDSNAGSGGGMVGYHRTVISYRGLKYPPDYYYRKLLEDKEEIIIEVEPEKNITDVVEQKLNELLASMTPLEEFKPININFIPVRRTVSLVHQPEPEPKIIDIRFTDEDKEKIRIREKNAMIRKKLLQLRTLVDITFCEQYFSLDN